jgi:hypothetical protein
MWTWAANLLKIQAIAFAGWRVKAQTGFINGTFETGLILASVRLNARTWARRV